MKNLITKELLIKIKFRGVLEVSLKTIWLTPPSINLDRIPTTAIRKLKSPKRFTSRYLAASTIEKKLRSKFRKFPIVNESMFLRILLRYKDEPGFINSQITLSCIFS
jgi:hypothetical protein